MMDIPIIDLTGLRSDGAAERRAVAAALGTACREVGFFYVTNHGVADEALRDVFTASRRFFTLPGASKQELSIKRSPHNRGYVEMEGERLDEHAQPDLKEAFNIGLELPPDDPGLLAAKPFHGINLWPELDGWRHSVLAYYNACWSLGRLIHRGFALDLGVAEDFFEDKLDHPIATLRLLHYPPARATMAAGQDGAGEHTDYGNLTILATDGVAGLQVKRRGGAWIDAPAIPGAFVCNIGDCLMRWTNDVYVSTPHRVVMPAKDRYSIAFFLDPNGDAAVEVLPSCLAPGQDAKYPPTTGADYIRSRLDATYDHRKDAAEA
jgi:isopenicillin N synthase-like dioxygenase